MLNEDYREILQRLLEEKADFIIVGAYALGAHGLPRATVDIDIFIKPDRNNSMKVFDALKKFGASLVDLSPYDFAEEGIAFQIGVAPRRIDIITSIDGVSFREAYGDKILVTIDGLDLPVLSLEMLIRSKEAVGRDQDLIDVKILKERLKGNV